MKKKASWIRHTHLFSADEYQCSSCGMTVKNPTSECPRCGAKMTDEKYDPSWVDDAAIMDTVFWDW